MDNPLVKWVLIIIVIGIWVNAIRVSLPAIIEYFKGRSEDSVLEVRDFGVNSGVSPNTSTKFRDIYSLRNPFKSPFSSGVVNYEKVASKEEVEVVSFFRLKGIFSLDGKKVAILEGKQEFGVSGIFYVSEGDTVMGERIVEVSDGYVIINKEGKSITLVVE